MAGWISAFKVIPWAELLIAAPAVVSGARKLWATVRKKDAVLEDGQSPESHLQAQIDELRNELAATSELLTTLAEHNGRLVEAIAILRVRTRVLFVICLVLAAAIVALAW
jgi:peptidoglycan hydrolase CwlO-like protein